MTEEVKPEFPQKTQSGSGSCYGYIVEARYTYPNPKEFLGKIWDNQWRQIPIVKGKVGVPSSENQWDQAGLLGYVPYTSAQALRWWFLSELNRSEGSTLGTLCFETRIVKVKVEYTHSCEKVGAIAEIKSDDLRCL